VVHRSNLPARVAGISRRDARLVEVLGIGAALDLFARHMAAYNGSLVLELVNAQDLRAAAEDLSGIAAAWESQRQNPDTFDDGATTAEQVEAALLGLRRLHAAFESQLIELEAAIETLEHSPWCDPALVVERDDLEVVVAS
jgi:hypothetical protein